MLARRAVCAIGGVIALLIAQTLGLAGAAGAASVGPDAQGWWSEAQQAPQSLPVDAVSGPNLEVGGDPTGPNAVAAVRFVVPGTIDDVPVDPASISATLTLNVAPNTAVGTPAVVACPVLGTWQPVSAGTWSTRPAYNCDRSAAGTLSVDKSAMVFKLDPSLQAHGGTYDLALTPTPANQAPFSVQFLPAGSGSMALGTGSAVGTPGESEPAVPSTEPLPISPDSNAGTAPIGGSSSFDAGSALPLDTSPDARSAVRAAPPGANSLIPAPIRRVVSTKRSQQAIALALLGGIVLALWWFGGQPARAPRLLGSLGPSVDVDDPNLYVRSGGIGRFARPRSKPPARL
jgi:hypothetical protein